ncbi:MAG: hypothetical protein HQ557_05770 [Bacteroidetes bacterium]|nr:hypothetical protein [Bacteroidota bacterium]
MAKNRSFFKSLFTLIVLAGVAFAVVYFFFPEQSEKYFSISWESRSGSDTEMDAAVEDVLSSISGAMEDAGATKKEVETALSAIDTDDLKESIELAWAEGKDAVGIFVNSIADKIDFGSINLDVVKNGIVDNLNKIDFSNAMTLIKDNLEKGLKDLSKAIKDAVN